MSASFTNHPAFAFAAANAAGCCASAARIADACDTGVHGGVFVGACDGNNDRRRNGGDDTAGGDPG